MAGDDGVNLFPDRSTRTSIRVRADHLERSENLIDYVRATVHRDATKQAVARLVLDRGLKRLARNPAASRPTLMVDKDVPAALRTVRPVDAAMEAGLLELEAEARLHWHREADGSFT